MLIYQPSFIFDLFWHFSRLKKLSQHSQGCWLLTKEWAYSSLEEGRWSPEEPFEMVNFSPAVSNHPIFQLPENFRSYCLSNSTCTNKCLQVRNMREERINAGGVFKSELFRGNNSSASGRQSLLCCCNQTSWSTYLPVAAMKSCKWNDVQICQMWAQFTYLVTAELPRTNSVNWFWVEVSLLCSCRLCSIIQVLHLTPFVFDTLLNGLSSP